MYIYCAVISALSAHIIRINLNMIFYSHVEHSPIKNNLHKVLYRNTHTHTTMNSNVHDADQYHTCACMHTRTHACTHAHTHAHTDYDCSRNRVLILVGAMKINFYHSLASVLAEVAIGKWHWELRSPAPQPTQERAVWQEGLHQQHAHMVQGLIFYIFFYDMWLLYCKCCWMWLLHLKLTDHR